MCDVGKIAIYGDSNLSLRVYGSSHCSKGGSPNAYSCINQQDSPSAILYCLLQQLVIVLMATPG